MCWQLGKSKLGLCRIAFIIVHLNTVLVSLQSLGTLHRLKLGFNVQAYVQTKLLARRTSLLKSGANSKKHDILDFGHKYDRVSVSMWALLAKWRKHEETEQLEICQRLIEPPVRWSPSTLIQSISKSCIHTPVSSIRHLPSNAPTCSLLTFSRNSCGNRPTAGPIQWACRTGLLGFSEPSAERGCVGWVSWM